MPFRLEYLYEKAEERSKQLQKTHELLDEWKKKGDLMLYSMIPKSVAEDLRKGVHPVDTCQVSTFRSIVLAPLILVLPRHSNA